MELGVCEDAGVAKHINFLYTFEIEWKNSSIKIILTHLDNKELVLASVTSEGIEGVGGVRGVRGNATAALWVSAT